MSIISRIAIAVFPDLMAPLILKGLPPSWAGIFKRIVRPTRVVKHPVYGKYSITLLSRDEERKLVEHNYKAMLKPYLHKYKQIDLSDYGPRTIDKNLKIK